MLERYLPAEFESKWRAHWKDSGLFKTREDADRPKFYGLDFFPYPSGAGLSVGHCRNYIPTDVLCRMKAMQGYNVLHPMGFDAFGLPAENEAIKRQVHPGPMVHSYGETYRRQLELIGNAYDWDRTFYSSDPSYYRWTQWIFGKLFEKGLAERKDAKVNWCPKDRTVLADEEVEGGLCWRCGSVVEKRAIPQWFFKITDYAQRLLDDLDALDWPEGIKNMQRNWIGRSEGVQFRMKVDLQLEDDFLKQKPLEIEVFTTRIDTIFGMTFCVIAPEHPLVAKLTSHGDADAIREYCDAASRLSDMTRQSTDRPKSGVFSGVYAINPATGAKVPIWVADYVLMGYGTGAIMAVPGHDVRDFEFASQFSLPIVRVIEGGELPFEAKDGVLVNSGDYSGLSAAVAQAQLAEWVEACELGHKKVNFKLRDWLISRQRYWGCPIPVIHDREGDMSVVPEDCLPVLLPEVENYEPTEDAQSPLAAIEEFVNVTAPDGSLGKRETDTMGGFACSSWYFLRFCDPLNDDEAWSFEKVKYWMPVDCYVGGAEHAVMHLLYARFWTKVLFDLGLVPVHEPFARLQNQGQVLAMTPYRAPHDNETLEVGEEGILVSFEEAKELPEDELMWRWARMSKSKGNVVTPDEAVEQYGADALRVYELFVAPFESDVQWSHEGMVGASRFLSRIFGLVSEFQPRYTRNRSGAESERSKQVLRVTHQTIAKVTSDIDRFAFNTAISALMIFVNELSQLAKVDEPETDWAVSEAIDALVLLLSPIAPHSADELWSSLGNGGSTYSAEWPVANEKLAANDEVNIAIQVNGKLRDTMKVSATLEQAELESLAKSREKVQPFLEGKEIRKVIVVPGRLVNIVAS